MPEIGELLKESRMKKGLSIEDIQEITKIRSRYIQAIEEGNLDKLPGQFYAKAFIKAYAEVVDLPKEALEEYQESIPTPDVEHIKLDPKYTSYPKSSSKISKWIVYSLIYILIALIVLIAYIFYVSSTDKNEELPGNPIDEKRLEVPYPPENEDSKLEENTNEPTNEETQEKADLQVTKISSSTYKNRPYDVYNVMLPSDMDVKVQLKFTDSCWIDIRNGGSDGNQLVSYTLVKGEETDLFILDEHLWIHLGNASGVDIFINDKQIKAGNEQGPKYISIKKIID